MASRQERRKAERDAAKRAPAQVGAAVAAGVAGAGAGGGGGGVAAARANASANPNPGGDWTTQAADPVALFNALASIKLLKQKAAEGDREARFSLGFWLLEGHGPDGTAAGPAGRSPKADAAGLALRILNLFCAQKSYRSLTCPSQMPAERRRVSV